MNSQFPFLSSPGWIGPMELRNRMVVTAMGVWLCEPDGTVSERQIAYHREQAQGGAALIITGATGVSYPEGGVHERQIAISDDRYMPGLSALAQAVHDHGSKLAFQLHRAAWQSTLDMRQGRALLVPSFPLPEEFPPMPFTPEELATRSIPTSPPRFSEATEEDIARLISQHAQAARRARQVGADGVELHVAHGYILGSFLSAAANRRTDSYGGSLENRARLALEVLEGIRAEVGADYPVWVKLDTREVDRPGGITIDDAVAAAKLFEAAGADAITASAYHASTRNKLHSESHTPQQPAANLPYAARLKSAVGIPLIVSGRIEPEVAEAAIAAGQIDFLSMGRKLLADPELPRKVVGGTPSKIRPCIYCYTCVSASYLEEPIRCAVRPETGWDHLPRPVACQSTRSVVVVGGGPSGMEAARRLDRLGFRVTLIERGSRLGGTLRIAAIAYEENERLLDWLVEQVRASGVEVRLSTEATPELLHGLKPDHVIVSVGGLRAAPPIPGAEQDHVFDGDNLRSLMLGEDADALKRKTSWLTRAASRAGSLTGLSSSPTFIRKSTHAWMPLGDQIAIIGGELVGLELAEFLAERGRKVTVVDDIAQFGSGLTLLRRMRVLDELVEAGVALVPEAKDISIGERSLDYTNSTGERIAVATDNVIIAKGATGDSSLADSLRAKGFDVHMSGDCAGISYIEGAMRGAAKAVEDICAIP